MFRAFKQKQQIEEQELKEKAATSYGLKQYNKYIYDPNPMSHDIRQESLINQFSTLGYTYITKLSKIYSDIINILSTQDEDFNSFCFNAETEMGINTEGVVKKLDFYPAVFYFSKDDTKILHSAILFNVREHDTIYIDSFCVNQLKKLRGGSVVLEEFITIVKENGFKKIQLDAISTAVSFYERLGFTIDDPSDIRDTILMTKNLQQGGKKRKTKKRNKKFKKTLRKKNKTIQKRKYY
jgi:hypothetical protein